MTNWRKLLIGVIGLELICAAVLVMARLGSTRPIPPLAEQYHDTLTGRELVALPDRFLFDGVAKWRKLAETYLAFGYFAKADACFRRALACDPLSPEIAFDHGYCLVRIGRLDEARQAFRRAAEDNRAQFSSRAWYHLGEVYLRLEQADEAARAFERAGDDHLPAVYQRAKLLVRCGRAAEARVMLDALTEAFPRDVRVGRFRAQAAAEQGDIDEFLQVRDQLEHAAVGLVLDDLEAVLKPIRDRYAMAREIAQAVEQERAGNTGPAAERLTRLVRGATRWDNVYPFLLQDAAAMQVRAGNAADGRELVVRQIDQEMFPTPKAWQLLGEVEFMERKWGQAFDAWTRSERMDPDAVDHFKLATVMEHLGDVPATRRHLALAGQFAGINLFREGRIDEARTMLRQASTIDADVGRGWFYLGECERLSGNDRDAAAAYRRCLKLSPEHGRARDRLRRLAEQP